MRFYTQQHRHYCGIDLHAHSMYICILDRPGKLWFTRSSIATATSSSGPCDPTARTWSSRLQSLTTVAALSLWSRSTPARHLFWLAEPGNSLWGFSRTASHTSGLTRHLCGIRRTVQGRHNR
jgi:hypothetical protein